MDYEYLYISIICFGSYSNFDVILKYEKQKGTKTNQRVYKMSHSFLKEKEI